MRSHRLLGGFESVLLLAILRLGDDAYGVTIRRELRERAHKDVAVGAIYTGLDRLERKGFVESWLGEPTAERGGRAKRFYRVTAAGLRAWRDTQGAVARLLDGLEVMRKGSYA
jgi:PadR family transcriptional regulator